MSPELKRPFGYGTEKQEGGADMAERTYIAIDLNNAEEKEMPI